MFSLNELLIVLHVTHQNGINWSEQSAETLAIEGYNLEACLGNDICSSWLILQQGTLAEVVSLLVLVDGDGRLARLEGFGSCSPTAHDHEEAVTFSSLRDNIVSFLVPFLEDGIGKLRFLI